MLHSSKHPFDIMFVILCVIAGATSHSVSNTSKTPPIIQPPYQLKTSFIDFILDTGPLELLRSSNSIHDEALAHKKRTSPSVKLHIAPYNICHLLTSILNINQLRFCQRHQYLLENILPQVIDLTKKECARITHDLKWNCTTIEPFLDRSSSLSFTREGALVRALLNVSMMYLTLRLCEEHNHRLCGCQKDSNHVQSLQTDQHVSSLNELATSELNYDSKASGLPTTKDLTLSVPDLKALGEGLPIRLSKSIIQRQGCLASVAFATAFTKVFLDTDDIKSLNRAHRILNEDHNDNKINRKGFSDKRLVDSDYKDLSFIKWTKSAINLHNNHVGRQLVRKVTRRHCRCHGLSGMCQFQTCWEQLPDLATISSELRRIYLIETRQIEAKNLGSHDRPDLYLLKSDSTVVGNSSTRLTSQEDGMTGYERVSPNELIYFYESPDYCEEQEVIKHPGTKGRMCSQRPLSNYAELSQNQGNDIKLPVAPDRNKASATTIEDLGSCEQLCCHRGFYGELTLDMVTCNCRFKFCCKIECEPCLRQHVQYYCL